MPADEMMATVTRPIEEAMKDIPGAVRIRSATGRGSAEISVFFTWQVDMVESELYVLSRLSQIRSTLPATVSTTHAAADLFGVPDPRREPDQPDGATSRSCGRLAATRSSRAFSASPASPAWTWSAAARRSITSSSTRSACRPPTSTLAQVTDALSKNNLIAPTGMHEENHTLYLTVVDGRVHNIAEIENLIVTADEQPPDPHQGLRARRTRPGAGLSTSSPPKGSTRCCSTSAASPTAAPSTSPTA